MQRVQVGDLEGIGHQAARTRTAPRPHRAAVVFGPVDEVAHDQKIAGETHLDDGGQLKLQALQVARHLRRALGLLGVEVQHALLQALVRGVAKVVLGRHAHTVHQGRRKVGQLRLAQHEGEVAALGDFFGVGNGRGQVGKQGLHLRCGLEVLLAGKAPHPLGVAEQIAV